MDVNKNIIHYLNFIAMLILSHERHSTLFKLVVVSSFAGIIPHVCIIIEMMRQTAGDEELDLFVSIDENDFVKGQRILISNLSQHGGRKARSYNVRSRANTARIER